MWWLFDVKRCDVYKYFVIDLITPDRLPIFAIDAKRFACCIFLPEDSTRATLDRRVVHVSFGVIGS
jgi:hypothetical protein